MFLLIVIGIISLLQIPKESSPDIKFGIISITTVYSGVNPEDIDSLITEKIEQEIEDIEGMRSITSTSSIWVSSVVVELENGVNTRDTMTDIKDRIDTISFPTEAEDTNVREISTRNELLFEALIYSTDSISHFDLMQQGREIQSQLEGTHDIASIDIGGSGGAGSIDQSSSDSDGYEIQVLLSKEKLELLDISVPKVVSVLQAYNKNTPLGNYTIWDLDYDFRFEWEMQSIVDLENTIVTQEGASIVRLKDIADISLTYDTTATSFLGFYEASGYPYIILSFNKKPWDNVFWVSRAAKNSLEDILLHTPWFENIDVKYSQDMSELIIEDYKTLWKTAIQTLILVFLTIFVFVGIRESMIASILLPVSFFITFTVLNMLGLSLNFLTNFSLVLTLGIAIDTIIVIIEWSAERQKLGYSRKNAPIMAVRDLRSPLTSGTMTTLVAFLPMMFLPWIMGRFLSYIPITVFTTLLGALILSLTIAAPLFFKLAKKRSRYIQAPEYESSLSPEEKDFLISERKGKTPETHQTISFRERMLEKLNTSYSNVLESFLDSKKSRFLSIFVPFILLILSFVFISPKLGFSLFPASDEGIITISITGPTGARSDYLDPYIPMVEQVVSSYHEVRLYYVSANHNVMNVYIELSEATSRERLWLKTVFEVEDNIIEQLTPLSSKWLLVEVKTLENGPPTGSPVGVKLHANSSQKIGELAVIAEDFKAFLQGVSGTKNVTTTSNENPWQFVFHFDENTLSFAWLTPDDILWPLRSSLAGSTAWSISSTYEDNDIVVSIEDFETNVSPQDIEDMIIPTSIWDVRVGNYASYTFEPGLSSITRDDTQVTIGVNSDVENGFLPSDIQPQLLTYAETYQFPEGITYSSGGENDENAELIQATLQSFFIALFLIFTILVFQFNSYSQPLIILYSVVLALLWVNIGLFLTGNPYSMTFGIGFIALTGVVVNDAIILVDRINRNIDRMVRNAWEKEIVQQDYERAIVLAGKARLQPIIVTTLTTVFWVLPLALQDAFWAGLGFTIIFGLFAGSTMTLFVIPALYYSLYLRKKMKQTQ